MASSRNLVFVLLLTVTRCVSGTRRFPCFFVFGDSLSDNGNNNNLQTRAKANYTPYGIDHPNGSTGRFTNGRTTVDFLAEYLHFKDFIPPYTTVSESKIIDGVNYASGSAGILDESGNSLGTHISLNKQLENHKSLISNMSKILGDERLAADRLGKCLYYVMIGSNDYLNNYFVPQHYDSSKRYDPYQYSDVLIQQYSQQLQALYNYGARKLVVNGLSPLGCVPYAKLKLNPKDSNPKDCFEEINDAVRIFNARLQSLLDSLQHNHTDAMFVYINNGKALPDYAKHLPHDELCCEVDDVGQCVPNKPVCPNRDMHMYWDAFHPTEIIHRLTAGNVYIAIKKRLFLQGFT